MKRPSKFDGEGKSLGGDLSPSPSAGPPGSSRLIPFPRSAAAALAAEGSEDAGVSSASASSFVQIGVPARAVVMRIKQGIPKISMPPRLREEEEPTSAADHSAGDLG